MTKLILLMVGVANANALEIVKCSTVEQRLRDYPACSDFGMHDIDGLIRCDKLGYWKPGGHKRKDLEWCKHLKGPDFRDNYKCIMEKHGTQVHCEWHLMKAAGLAFVPDAKAAKYRKLGWIK